ncbi:MAG: ABC transporter substrate-binding protein [Firmicutes bacterium]|nr:ABC transporter substrate-binding protein [Bacillota bacterium]
MVKLRTATKIAVALGTAVVMTLGTAVGAEAAGTTTIAYAGGWQTNGIYNPQPQANGNMIQDGVAYAPLAWYKFTGNFDFWPVLAKNWQVSHGGNQVTVHLNPKAKWSNGTPVTAKDVYVTFEMQFIVGNAQSWGLTGMKIVNPETIIFYKNPKFLYSTSVLLQQILNNNNIMPAVDFQQMLPADALLWKTVKAAGGPAKAKTTIAAEALLTKWANVIEGHNFESPANLIYDGPWEFSRSTSAEQLYVKNPDYVLANNVTADEMLVTNQTTNDVTWRALENGTIDYAGVSFSPPVYKTVMSVHDNHFVAAPQSTGMSMMFNENVYPYNLIQVRQAIAYMINRHAARLVGEPIGSLSVKIPDGMTQAANEQWLTHSQLASLNPYNYDPTRAAALLKSVGFKKTASGWKMPNGKPFTLTISAPNFSDWDAGIQEIASQLGNLGVKTNADVMDSTIFYSPTDGAGTGKFAVATRWWGGWNVYPSNTYNQAWFVDNDYSVSNTGQIDHGTTGSGLNAPMAVRVPGLGFVNNLKLTVAIEGNLPETAQRTDIYKLAKAYNYWVPALDVWNQMAGRTYSTANWTWPDFQHNTALLNMFTYNNPIVVYQSLGLMKPKQ